MAKKSAGKSLLRSLLDRIRRLRWPEPDVPGDPYAYRVAPVWRGPKGRSGAAAVAEPEEDSSNTFFSRR